MTPRLEYEELSESAGADPAQLANNANAQGEGWEDFISTSNFALLHDKAACWMIRVSDIFTLEAYGDCTRVHLHHATPLVRRPLQECERRLERSSFFRARVGCIVNLGRVSQTRTLVPFQLVFVLQDGREIVASRERSLVFRRSREL